MKDLMLSVRFQTLRIFGVLGLFGLLLLTAAALVGYLLIPTATQQGAHLRQQVSTAKVSATQTSIERRNELNAGSQLKNFSDGLPLLATNAKDIQKLFALAKEGDIELTKAEYQLTADPGAEFVRYQVTVPVKHRYPIIRRFAAGAMNALPHLALDELQFARSQASDDVVEAQLRFTLFYRAQ